MGLLTVLALLACPTSANVADFEVTTTPAHQVGDLPTTLTLTALDDAGEPLKSYCGSLSVTGLIQADGLDEAAVTSLGPFEGGVITLEKVRWNESFRVHDGSHQWTLAPERHHVPGWLSILPPLFAILLAIVFRQALIALFAGIWLGGFFITGYKPLTALLRTFDTYLVRAVGDSDHAAIILFTLSLGGMVGILSRSGATRALVDRVALYAKTRRSGMLASWGAGLVVFFDDYANCMLVGNTLRPLTDRLKISREKLAFIVDSTAAPIATVAVVSTWIGFQLSQFDGVIPGEPYDIFLKLLPYSFYSFFMIAFVLMICVSGRDFGPMLKAERRAKTGKLLRDGAVPLVDRELTEMSESATGGRARDAMIAIGSVIVIVFVGVYVSGLQSLGEGDHSLREIIAASNSYAVLLWAGFGGSLIALLATMVSKSLSATAGVDAWIGGVKAMLMAVLILVLAWGIGDICKNELLTGPWVLSQIDPDPRFIPVLTFLLCGFIAFATGSSFSTMAIVIPIAGALAWSLTGESLGLEASVTDSIRYSTLAAVLSGAVFGDHCSPISDTTIMSSMASAADHVDHVRTQSPYAFACASAAAGLGFIPAGFGLSPAISLVVGLAALAILVRFVGKKL